MIPMALSYLGGRVAAPGAGRLGQPRQRVRVWRGPMGSHE